MQTPDYEGIWAALFEHIRVSLGTQVVSCGRQHVIPPTLTPEMQPAVFVLQGPHKVDRAKPVAKYTLRGFIVVYVSVPPDSAAIGQEQTLAATNLNVILAAIDQALQPDNVRHQWFTLGGRVERCQIEGDAHVEIDSIGQQPFAALPVVFP